MDMKQIETEALNAVDEYTCSCTVVITSTNSEVQHGSGVVVSYGGECYILTAAHVLAGEPDNEKIRVIGRPDGPLQLLRGKQQLGEAISRGDNSHIFASATGIRISARLNHVADDIAALKVLNAVEALPHTISHDLSRQENTETSVGQVITIFGFPGELARPHEHSGTSRRGLSAYPHITIQTVNDLGSAPDKMKAGIDLITDFDYPDDQCDPRGMSGCGAWSVPGATRKELWSAGNTQLLGILIGYYRQAKLLRFVSTHRIKHLLSTGN